MCEKCVAHRISTTTTTMRKTRKRQRRQKSSARDAIAACKNIEIPHFCHSFVALAVLCVHIEMINICERFTSKRCLSCAARRLPFDHT